MHQGNGCSAKLWKKRISLSDRLVGQWSGGPVLRNGKRPKCAQASPVRNASTLTFAKKVMDDYIRRFGCFGGLHSHQGVDKDGAAFGGLCDLIIVAKTMAAHYYPHGMGWWRD